MKASEILRELQLDGAEIGAHLHVWESPPFLTSDDDRRFAAFGHDLPVEHFSAKLAGLTASIGQVFGAPTSYRAGRFGFAAEHIVVLEQLGYRVDSSITPLVDRRAKVGIPLNKGGRGGRDYRRAPLDAYKPDYADDLRPGRARLWELPLTAGPRRNLPSVMLAVHQRGPQLLQRALRKLRISEIVTASPVHYSAERFGQMLETAASQGRRVLNLTLHSSETMAGGSPSIRDSDSLRALFDRIRQVVERLQRRFIIKGCTLSEAAAELERESSTAARGETSTCR